MSDRAKFAGMSLTDRREKIMRPDYAESGLDIQGAMVAEAKRLGTQASHPLSILWNRRDVQTADRIDAPKVGRVRIEFISITPQPKQAVDLELPKGRIALPDGSTVSHLRT